MHLPEVAARSVQLFPDIWNRIDADDIYPPVRQKEEIVHHLVKYPWIFVIQIPLIRIKCSHDVMSDIRKPCEIPRSRRGEHLRHCLFIHRRFLPIVEEKVAAHVLSIPLARLFRPLMILRSVVHDKVHADIDTLLMAGSCQAVEIFHGSQFRLDSAEIRNRIASVRAPLGCVEKRHQVNIVHIARFDVVQFCLHTLHIAGKIVDVEHHPQHIILLIPVLIRLPFPVARL